MESKHLQSIRELNLIIRISQSIIGTLDYQMVLQLLSDGMSELLDIETAAIYTLENDYELHLGATTPALPPDLPEGLRKALVADHPHIKMAVTTRKPVVVTNTKVTSLSPAERSIVEVRNLISLLFLPFIQGNQPLGVLILGTCNKIRSFTQHEINLGQTVANHLSIAIQNSRFHSELQTYKDNLERLVAERTHELEAANEELKAMNEELHMKNEIVNKQKKTLETTICSLKSMQAKLIQSEKMASLGILTAGVAHEINNPLNFIMGAYHGLENYFSQTAPNQRESVAMLLEGIKTGTERVSAIVQGLSQFSRDSKTFNEECCIHSIIDNCLVMLHNQYKDRIVIERSNANPPTVVKGNAGKLHQVFINLLLNSIQAIEKEGKILILSQLNNDSVSITITDTGCGIAKENLPRITDPFFTTKDPRKGIGLGLSITYTIIQEHNGLIEFESVIGKGTTVIVTLPVNRSTT